MFWNLNGSDWAEKAVDPTEVDNAHVAPNESPDFPVFQSPGRRRPVRLP